MFLVLAAQFESLTSALVILFTVPFGLAAAALAIMLTGGTMNVYSQIGLVLLVGVMAKNGILIVEFANIRRDEGADVDSAIREACTHASPAGHDDDVGGRARGLPLIFAQAPAPKRASPRLGHHRRTWLRDDLYAVPDAGRLSHPGAVLKTARRGDAATDRRTPGGAALSPPPLLLVTNRAVIHQPP